MGERQPLGELAAELLLFALEVRRRSVDLPNERLVRERLKRALTRFEEDAVRAGYAEPEIDEARYALAAAIDEALQFSAWEGKQSWSARPLQTELFDDRNAGVGFFERLPKVQKRTPAALEVYYLSLALGFRGRHHLSGGEEAQRVLENLAATMAGPEGRELSPGGLPGDLRPAASREPPWALMTGVLFVGCCGVAAALWFYLASLRSEVLAAIAAGG